ncbi:3-oxoacyl-[acyl-carrier-protein] reductase [Pseudobutyrivibrio sp. NOR37]|uniref:3-oxoacyl-[acyl-carrier-protein] reductase n=2 Tax=Pseudobutyrivibrio TaxID=46205 RepID=A0A2G3E849_9FIRM|nr:MULTISPECIES: 3-oxoacyl-[acyl-carrier-protein] reductase [Pseudobutyrivibrio]NEX00323.1 3-oxoacyl-[acyl-carrier-protein] reductase [Pseudobutyrivibrio xylanivorans]PHU39315.1 3-oxoacyl-[acyl-carrier-protein] reductase [Pseudobutyrivibrio ruminis]SFR84069.1 3-oxoacyl-[acyl-carrier-protein] reductase [Pseudobutyrivibrio sp. NOR37]
MSVALITGASRGIGRVIAETMAKAGYDIAICYSGNESAAQETISLCKKYGVQAIYVKADVSNADDVANMFSEVKSLLGPVDVLVNNAGITKDGLLLRMTEEDFEKVVDINLKGAFLCTKAAIKDMLKAKKGSIINITSIVGVTGNAGQANYSASKAGLIGFTKSVAKEYGSKGITVNAVAPGFIQTAMTDSLPEEVKSAYLKQIPLGRFGTPEDVASVVEFLASEKAAYVTGQVIEVTGGM